MEQGHGFIRQVKLASASVNDNVTLATFVIGQRMNKMLPTTLLTYARGGQKGDVPAIYDAARHACRSPCVKVGGEGDC